MSAHEIYYTSHNGGMKYWLPTKRTEHFITFTRLEWSMDMLNEPGVMRLGKETVRVKVGRHLHRKSYGLFSREPQPERIIIKPPTP